MPEHTVGYAVEQATTAYGPKAVVVAGGTLITYASRLPRVHQTG